MIRRFVLAVLDAQTGWADPLGGAIQALLKAIFGPLRFLKDFLNGTWLGHSMHAMLTDVPVGSFTLAIVLDILDLRTAADVAIAVGIITMLAAALAGWADYTDTDVKPQRDYATVHQVLMLVSLALYAISLWIRLSSVDRTAAIWLSLGGYVILAVSAYVGGEVVYGLGNMVDRHAFRTFGQKWQPLDVPDLEEGKPIKTKAGAQTLVVVKRGDTLHALHDVCAHAGCSLAEGKVVDGTIECGCHGSRYRLIDGHVVQGPSTFDQPLFEVRKSSDGKWEARRAGETA